MLALLSDVWNFFRFVLVGSCVLLLILLSGCGSVDELPPRPLRMAWETAPSALGKHLIYMEASETEDRTEPVRYQFTRVSPDSRVGPWQLSPRFTDSNLEPGTEYTYSVMARDNAGNHTLASIQLTASTEGDQPDPGPDPDPDPDPLPPGKVIGYCIYEAADLDDDPDFAQVIASLRIRELSPGRFDFRPYDQDVLDQEDEIPGFLRPWIQKVDEESLSLPWLFLVHENGRELASQRLPAGVDATIQLIRRHLP